MIEGSRAPTLITRNWLPVLRYRTWVDQPNRRPTGCPPGRSGALALAASPIPSTAGRTCTFHRLEPVLWIRIRFNADPDPKRKPIRIHADSQPDPDSGHKKLNFTSTVPVPGKRSKNIRYLGGRMEETQFYLLILVYFYTPRYGSAFPMQIRIRIRTAKSRRIRIHNAN